MINLFWTIFWHLSQSQMRESLMKGRWIKSNNSGFTTRFAITTTTGSLRWWTITESERESKIKMESIFSYWTLQWSSAKAVCYVQGVFNTKHTVWYDNSNSRKEKKKKKKLNTNTHNRREQSKITTRNNKDIHLFINKWMSLYLLFIFYRFY